LYLKNRLPTLVFLYDWSVFSALFNHSWRLNYSLRFQVLKTENNESCPVAPCHALSSPMRRMKWCNGHGSSVRWVTWVMVTKDDPFQPLVHKAHNS